MEKRSGKFKWLLKSKLLLPMFVCGLSVLMVGLTGPKQIVQQVAEFNQKRSIHYRDIAAHEAKMKSIDWKDLEKKEDSNGIQREIAAEIQGKELEKIYS